MKKFGVVQGERGLFRQRLQQDEIRLVKLRFARRIRHREHAEKLLPKDQGYHDRRANGQRGVVMLHHARVRGRIRQPLSPPTRRDPADDAFADGKLLRLEHLFDEFGPRPKRTFQRIGQRTMRRKQSFDRDAAQRAAVGLLENARAQRTCAKDRRMHNALVQFLAGQALAQRLGHEVNKLKQPLAVLRELLVLLLDAIGVPARSPKEDQQREDACQQEERDEPVYHDDVLTPRNGCRNRRLEGVVAARRGPGADIRHRLELEI